MGTTETFEIKTKLLRALGIAFGVAFLVTTLIVVFDDGWRDDRGKAAAFISLVLSLLCMIGCRVAQRIEVSDEAVVIQPAGLRIARSEIESVRVMSRSALRPDPVLHKMKITTRERRWRWIPFRLYWFMGKISIDLYWMEDGHGFARALGADLSDFTGQAARPDG